MNSADAQIEILERAVQDRVKLCPQFRFLKTVPGIGPILALTIMLETGEIERFASGGNYASYCRCVGSKKINNGKRKGSDNTKNGNKYLAWAFVEAANFAIRLSARIKSFYQERITGTSLGSTIGIAGSGVTRLRPAKASPPLSVARERRSRAGLQQT